MTKTPHLPIEDQATLEQARAVLDALADRCRDTSYQRMRGGRSGGITYLGELSGKAGCARELLMLVLIAADVADDHFPLEPPAVELEPAAS